MTTQIPSQLYKYRTPDIGRMKDILLLNQMWAADPTTFNDPFDCYPHIDLTGTYDEARAWMALRIARTGQTVSEEKQHVLAKQIERDGFISLMEESPEATFRNSISQFGIIALTTDPKNILMWSHYAQNHTGVCLEFATDIQPFLTAVEVRYDKARPVFRPMMADRSDLIERVLLYKAKFWEYEHEWRYFRVGAGLISFEPSTLTSIILGAAATPHFVGQLRALIDERQAPIEVKQASFDLREYKLHVDRLE